MSNSYPYPFIYPGYYPNTSYYGYYPFVKQAAQPPMDPSMMGGMPPMDPSMGGGMPMDPSMMGGMPPTDPSMMGGMPPMDPSMGGGMPMDPSMGGGMPMDPSMMGGMPPMDPSMMAPPPPQAPIPAGQPDPATAAAVAPVKMKVDQWLPLLDTRMYNLTMLLGKLFEALKIPLPTEALVTPPNGQGMPVIDDPAKAVEAPPPAEAATKVAMAILNGDFSDTYKTNRRSGGIPYESRPYTSVVNELFGIK